MRILVTGAAGFIGHRLAYAAAEAGHAVTCVDALRGDPATRDLRAARLERLREVGPVHITDLAIDDLDTMIKKVDAVAHLAGATGVRTSFGTGFPDAVRDNVTATGRMAEACRVAGARLVLASSSSVYGSVAHTSSEDAPLRPQSPYGATKVGAEAVVHAHEAQGLEASILRYFTVYGPGQRPDMAAARFIAEARAGRPLPVFGDGSQVRAYTFVDDVVAVTLAALTSPATGFTGNVAGPELVSTDELARAVGVALGRDIDIDHGPPAAGDVARTAADTRVVADLLGLTPTTRLVDGLAAQVREAS
ncbi:NAD-dependent epimerase/dehydratase family protein [Mariniluteicoccus endophyticus]